MAHLSPSAEKSPAHLACADGSGAMFDGIAAKYDRLNRLMSFGLDGRWRKKLVASVAEPVARQIAEEGQAHVLDIATGTADVALALARRYDKLRVTGIDPSPKMLAIGREKVARKNLTGRIELEDGSATELPKNLERACAATISFGIRNFPDRLMALKVLRKALLPNGRLSVLELGEPSGDIFAALARFHVHTLVPTLGRMLSGKEAYAYLADSIAAFLPPQQFVALLGEAGFVNARAERLSFGALHLFVADVPGSN